jgi:hypothetical protein
MNRMIKHSGAQAVQQVRMLTSQLFEIASRSPDIAGMMTIVALALIFGAMP